MVRSEREIDPADFREGATAGAFLLGDDDDVFLRLPPCLASLDLEVARVTDGEEALAEAKRRQCGCILHDMDMPVMDGFDAAQAMREADRRGFVVAMTGTDRGEGRRRALATGADDCITGSSNARTFRRIIESIDRERLASGARKFKSAGRSYGSDPIFLVAAEIGNAALVGGESNGIGERTERPASRARQVRGPEDPSDSSGATPSGDRAASGRLHSDDG